MKDRFIELLRSTNRDGVETIIKNLEILGFFEAPASTKFHLSTEGGLCEHSVNVCEIALMIRDQLVQKRPDLEPRISVQTVIFASLLHDVCKAEIYKQGTRNVKNEVTGVWEKVPVYEIDCSYFPIGHGEKSVIRLLTWGIKLTKDEMLAIRWHMSAWDLPFQSTEEKANLNESKDQCPLLSILQAADGLASGVLETK